MIGPNGHTVQLDVYPGGASVLTHRDDEGRVLKRTYSGKCGDTTVGPIDCPEGESPSVTCAIKPGEKNTIKCVPTK